VVRNDGQSESKEIKRRAPGNINGVRTH
jgi:hypothetical protein